MKKLIFLLFIFPLIANAQTKDSLKTKQGKIFANLYSSFNYQKSKSGSSSGFGMSTALLGYTKTVKSKIKGTIIFDVTRTTNNIKVFDSTGTALQVNYFEGSKYTAFLKMAAIEWLICPKISISAGQLLNTQYLTFQDKFWQHRYVDVTFQEKNRFGMPADFGMQLNLNPYKNLKINIGAFNGEGPFRHQDPNSNFLLSFNIEFKPKFFILKAYYAQHFCDNPALQHDKHILSLFGGYKRDKLVLGLEYDLVRNANFMNINWQGFSSFAFYSLSDKWQIFYRFDYMLETFQYRNTAYHIAGIEYSPVKNLKISANYRYLSFDNTNMIFLNIGLKI
jgi:opacity protein-like surface antigen